MHSSVKNKFISKLRALMASRKLGDPSERDTFQGPQVDATQRDRIVGYLDIGKKDGELILGGNATSVNGKVSPYPPAMESILREISGMLY